MSEKASETCRDCGRRKQSQRSGTITQWMAACTCSVQPPDEMLLAVQVCARCNKRVLAGRAGSLTTWIFAADRCQCEVPDLPPTTRSELAQPKKKGPDKPSDVENELDLSAAQFPIDRYKPISIIGVGASGYVYLCRDRLLGKKVAVKCLRSVTAEQLVSFQKEAKATSQLNHPFVIKVLDFGGTQDGAPYMVMEYFKGISLSDRIKEAGPIAEPTAARILQKVADALFYAHSKGIMHRDLKSSNILVLGDESGELDVRLIDFGIARLKHMTQEPTIIDGKTIAGTPEYMSPDQVHGFAYDERSEIYSLGCVLFEALTGKTPFSGATALETISLHAHHAVPNLSDACPGRFFSDRIEHVVQVCLAKDPSERWASAHEVSQELAELSEEPDEQFTPNESAPAKPVFRAKFTSRLTVKQSVALVFTAAIVSYFGIYVAKRLDVETINVEVPEFTSDISEQDQKSDFFYQTIENQNWLIAVNNMHARRIKRLGKVLSVPNLKICDPEMGDSDLKYLRSFPIRILDVSGTKIADIGLRTIAVMPKLQSLVLNHVRGITDNGMEMIAAMPKLKMLSLSGTKVTANGLRRLCGMEELMGLDISDTDIDRDEAIEILSQFRKLKVVRIGDRALNGEQVSALAKLNLHALSLSGAHLTDADLKPIKSMSLFFLDLSNNDITKKGIDAIDPTAYWILDLRQCPRITAADISAMQKVRGHAGMLINDYHPVSFHTSYVPSEHRIPWTEFWYVPDQMEFPELEFFRQRLHQSRLTTNDYSKLMQTYGETDQALRKQLDALPLDVSPLERP